MKPRTFLSLLLTSLLPLLAAETKKPNILFIVADDLGYGELGCYGGQGIPTPNIDRLITKGARFTDGYVTAPFCAASRAALLTGRYQTSFGFEFNPIGSKNLEPGIGLPVGVPTIADRLRAAGRLEQLERGLHDLGADSVTGSEGDAHGGLHWGQRA